MVFHTHFKLTRNTHTLSLLPSGCLSLKHKCTHTHTHAHACTQTPFYYPSDLRDRRQCRCTAYKHLLFSGGISHFCPVTTDLSPLKHTHTRTNKHTFTDIIKVCPLKVSFLFLFSLCFPSPPQDNVSNTLVLCVTSLLLSAESPRHLIFHSSCIIP